jgi:hypothetical protein
MLFSATSQSLTILFLCVLTIQFIYFIGMDNFMNLNLIDTVIIIMFNLIFLWLITSSALDRFKYMNLPEKPKSHYIGIGGNMNEFIWGMFYDYKVIVDRHDRDRLLGNPSTK